MRGLDVRVAEIAHEREVIELAKSRGHLSSFLQEELLTIAAPGLKVGRVMAVFDKAKDTLSLLE
jgi:hypothetical protein